MTKRYLNTPEEVIDALQDGKEIYDEESVWKLHKGFIVRKNKDSDYWIVNDGIARHFRGLYVDEPEPLKLEVGKFYKTRDGRKAWIVGSAGEKEIFPFTVVAQEESEFYSVAQNGRRWCDDTDESDLVAPWEE
jgi:hypothetical protein